MTYILNGYCRYFGLTTCTVGLSLFIHTLTHSLWSLFISFAYRYFILFHGGIKRRHVLLVLFLFYVPSLIQAVSTSSKWIFPNNFVPGNLLDQLCWPRYYSADSSENLPRIRLQWASWSANGHHQPVLGLRHVRITPYDSPGHSCLHLYIYTPSENHENSNEESSFDVEGDKGSACSASESTDVSISDPCSCVDCRVGLHCEWVICHLK